MSNYSEVLDLARALTGNENLYSVQPFIKIAGDTVRGLLLERIVYWSDKSTNSDLKRLRIFYKSAEEWEEELGLSYDKVTRARKKLEEMGFIMTSKRRVAGAPTIHYYANIEAIKAAITQSYQGSSGDYANRPNVEIQEVPISKEAQLEIQGNRISSYNSTYNSTKTTSNEVGASPPPAVRPVPKTSRPEEIPAARVFREVVGKFVLNNTQIREIDERVGRDPPALEKWRETVKAWQLAGNKINGIKGMLDWFRDGIPVYQKARTNGTHKVPGRDQRDTKQSTPGGGLSDRPDPTDPAAWAAMLKGK